MSQSQPKPPESIRIQWKPSANHLAFTFSLEAYLRTSQFWVSWQVATRTLGVWLGLKFGDGFPRRNFWCGGMSISSLKSVEQHLSRISIPDCSERCTLLSVVHCFKPVSVVHTPFLYVISRCLHTN
jgi:hypothetical protein